MALVLPIDVALSRLILFGCALGMVYEAVIIALDLSFDQDYFALPNPFTFKTPSLYAEAVESSLEGRVQYDCGHF